MDHDDPIHELLRQLERILGIDGHERPIRAPTAPRLVHIWVGRPIEPLFGQLVNVGTPLAQRGN